MLPKTSHKNLISSLLGLALILAPTAATSATWGGNGSNSNWSDAGNWDNPPTNGQELIFTGTSKQVNINDLLTTTTGITFAQDGFQISGNSLDTGNLTINGNAQINLPITLPETRTITIATGKTLGISGTTTGAGGITKSGEGTLQFQRAATYAGDTAVLQGTITTQAITNALPGTTRLKLGYGPLSAKFAMGDAPQNIRSANKEGVGTDNRIVGSGTLVRYMYLSSDTNETCDVFLGGPATNENNLELVKEGTGDLTLVQENTYRGRTYINKGRLLISKSQNLGTGNRIIMSGSSGSPVAIFENTGANVQITPTFGINPAGAIIRNSNTSSSLSINTAVEGNGRITFDCIGDIEIPGNLTGGGGFTKTGSGKLTLSGTNTYTGTTIISAGTLVSGKNDSIKNTSTTTIGSTAVGATLDLKGWNQTLPGITRTGTNPCLITNTGVQTSTFTLNTAVTNNNCTVNIGELTGSAVKLIKEGTAMLNLDSNNTFKQGFEINAGTLNFPSGSKLTLFPKSGIPSPVTGTGTLNLNGTVELNTSAENGQTYSLVLFPANTTFGAGFTLTGFIQNNATTWTKQESLNGMDTFRSFDTTTRTLTVTQSFYEPFRQWLFDNITMQDPNAARGHADDPDGDGLHNLGEFAFGTDPLVANTNSNAHVFTTPGGNTLLTVAIRNGTLFNSNPDGGLISYGIENAQYKIQATTDLTQWTLPVVEDKSEDATLATDNLPDPATGSSWRSFRVSGTNPSAAFLRAAAEYMPSPE
jgi:fibronectin-binding autotransporter adhesin